MKNEKKLLGQKADGYFLSFLLSMVLYSYAIFPIQKY